MQASIKREGDGVSSKRAARPAVRETGPWWTHAGLTVAKGRLLIAGRDAETLARGRGTPIYVYDLNRVGEQIEALQGAIRRQGLEARVRLALKAQHEPEILDYVRRDFGPGTDSGVGLDVCSPGEVQRALECAAGLLSTSATPASTCLSATSSILLDTRSTSMWTDSAS